MVIIPLKHYTNITSNLIINNFTAARLCPKVYIYIYIYINLQFEYLDESAEVIKQQTIKTECKASAALC